MEIEKFLQELLEKQNLSLEQESALQIHKDEVTKFLRKEFGDAPVIKYAGSHAKGTMNAEQYDLDIVCYFPSSDTRSLKEIRENVSAHLKNKYLIQPKASAERITNLKESSVPNGYHIDVVPGRFIEGTKDVFIHVAYGDKERMQTNLKVHIDHIVQSGCVPVLRLAKLWAHRNNVGVKTFILELFVVRALSGARDKANLKTSFLKLLQALKDEFSVVQLVDPANSNNIVSQLISPSEQVLVVHNATEALNRIEDSNNIAECGAVFQEKNSEGNRPPVIPPSNSGTLHKTPDQGFAPNSPWSVSC